ncbi:hypothetical protein N1851_017727 [Merluccius polli]|uniref:Uncharacterized protein n=1 Tax=Merluccius polli TaxID=89951 RepID=A0AA47P1X8_MERPO|nr:hypothetical protein N1851_017727 [Merluccius polli]
MASPKCHWVYYFILIWLLILTAGEVLFFFFYTAGELNRVIQQPTIQNPPVTFTTAAAGVKVTLVRNKKVILEGTVQQSNLSTGLLGKVEVMSAAAQCEQGFSAQNRIKNATRSCLGVSTTENLMWITVEGPSVEEFNPTPAVDRWLTSNWTMNCLWTLRNSYR